MWVNLVIMLVAALISYALAPKPAKPKAAALEDFELPTPDEGTPQCVVFGDVWIPDWCVLSYGNLRMRAIKTSSGK
ncbi:MAG: hypothetical protein LBE62_02230 [Azonexus sp.]|jgi:hypothetical protein|nr:hypothetical protein [Azonexus sp.]